MKLDFEIFYRGFFRFGVIYKNTGEIVSQEDIKFYFCDDVIKWITSNCSNSYYQIHERFNPFIIKFK